jgi:hypothetical protein
MRSSLVLLCSLFLTGCALGPSAVPTPDQGRALQGNVHGGRQPIAGAHVYLFAANTTGYGQPSVSILNPSATGAATDPVGTYVTTDANGTFTITNDYSCTPNTQVYLYALGGDPGAGINSAAGLLAVLGNCPTSGSFLASFPLIQVNELTTIAAAYALSGFATDATHVSSSGTPLAQIDIANAFLNADKIASIVTGTSAQHTPANSATSVPQDEIDTLGNILASCVNSTDPTTPPATPNACNTLFSNTASGSTVPADTASAAINIAHNPGANVAALYALTPPNAPFEPALSSQPYDFTIAVTYFAVDGNLGDLLTIDGSGNVWGLGIKSNPTGPNAIGIAELTPSGAPAPGSPFTGNGLLGPLIATFDPSGNLWVANSDTAGPGTGSLSEFTSTGSAAPGSPFSGNGLSNPNAIASDASGNIWLTSNYSGSVSAFTSSGSPTAGSPFTATGVTFPSGIAIQPITGNVWITDGSGTGVAKLTPAGVPVTGSPFIAGGLSRPGGIAFDSSSNAWIGNSNVTLTELNSTGGSISGSPFSYAPSYDPTHSVPPNVAIDGAGNIWTVSWAPSQNYIAENTSTGASAVGSPFHGLAYPYGPTFTSLVTLAIDGSGNVWVTNSGGLTEIIGAATPVVTPLSVGVKNNTLATRP